MPEPDPVAHEPNGVADAPAKIAAPAPVSRCQVFEPAKTDFVEAALYRREDLAPGMTIPGPALIVEDQTTTVVGSHFDAAINHLGYIVLNRRREA